MALKALISTVKTMWVTSRVSNGLILQENSIIVVVQKHSLSRLPHLNACRCPVRPFTKKIAPSNIEYEQNCRHFYLINRDLLVNELVNILAQMLDLTSMKG